jgi:hypothetical protein
MLVLQIKSPFTYTEKRNAHKHIKYKFKYCHYPCFSALKLWKLDNFASSYVLHNTDVQQKLTIKYITYL